MQFTCYKNELYDAIAKVAGCTVARTTMPFLEFIRVRLKDKKLELNGFNLDYGIRAYVNADCEEGEEGEFLIMPRLFGESVRRMDSDTVNIFVSDKYIVELKGGQTELTIAASFAGEYPELPTVDEAMPFEINENTFKNMIRQTKYACSNNEMKPVMMGELFDIEDGVMTLVAVDGYRLSICKQKISALSDANFIIHKKALSLIESFLRDGSEENIVFFTNGRHASFKLSGCVFVVRLMEGVFHNYKSSIPQSFKTEVLINSKKLMHSLERCAFLIDDKNKSPIRCDFNGNALNIKCETKNGRINDFVPMEMSGEAVKIGFNNQFLLDAARYADTEMVKIQLSGDRAVVQMIPTDNDDFRFLLMPIRIRD